MKILNEGQDETSRRFKNRLRKKLFRLCEFKFCLREINMDFLKPYY